MNPADYQSMTELFHELVALPAPDQQTRLAELELDDEVRTVLNALLKDEAPVTAFEEHHLGDVVRDLVEREDDDQAQPDPLPTAIGSYQVLRELGRGGMGVVYAARRAESDLAVAVKVIRPSMDSGSFIKRFRREAAVLRTLRHPGIAAFYDAGEAAVATAAGSTTMPFLAMELVDGLPLDEFADRHALDDRDRIELLARVCDALHHAHERGVIHRDLKPGNILVIEERTGDAGGGHPKVLDFGIARASGDDLQTVTMTAEGVLMGTLPYMSPEQVAADGRPVDGRSDVYSLGVLLYELLSGRQPLDLRGHPVPVATRMILEDEPARLGSDVHRLRGDLEVVAAKALEKEPRCRYETAASFAADLRRFAAGEAIAARPATWIHRTRKFVRRNKALSTAMAALFIGLAATIGVALERTHQAAESAADSYRSSLGAAALAQSVGDLVEMHNQLETAPEDLRGWEWRILQAAEDESLLVGQAPAGSEHMLRFTPSGTSIVGFARTGDGSVAEVLHWDTTGRVLARRTLTIVDSIDISERGTWLAWTDGQQLHRARSITGSDALTTPLPPGTSTRVKVADTGSVVGTNVDGGVTLYDLPVDGVAAPPRQLTDGVPVTAVPSSDGRRVIWSADGDLVHWQRNDPDVLTRIPLRKASLDFAPDSRTIIASRHGESLIELWRISDAGTLLHVRDVSIPGQGTRAGSFSGDGQLFAVDAGDLSLHIRSVATGELIATRVGHTRPISAIALSADGGRVASLDLGGSLRLWSPAPDPRVLGHGSFVYASRFSPDGARVYTFSWDKSVRCFDAATSRETARWDLGATPGGLVVDPLGRWIAVAGQESVTVLDATLGAELQRLAPETGDLGRSGMDVSPTGDRLAVLSEQNGLTVYDTRSWQPVAEQAFSSLPQFKLTVRFHPDGQLIAASFSSEACVLLDATALEVVRELPFANALAFSPDGHELALATADDGIHVIRLDGDDPAEVMEGRTDLIYALVYAPDGSRLLSGSRDHTLGVWDVQRRELIARLRGHTGYVYDLDVDPAGERVVTASGDTTAHLWEPFPLSERLLARERALSEDTPDDG